MFKDSKLYTILKILKLSILKKLKNQCLETQKKKNQSFETHLKKFKNDVQIFDQSSQIFELLCGKKGRI